MTRDDIIRMAQEAAIMPPNWGATENQWRTLHDFADLVAAAEREACIDLVAFYGGPVDLEAAIRARGNT